MFGKKHEAYYYKPRTDIPVERSAKECECPCPELSSWSWSAWSP